MKIAFLISLVVVFIVINQYRFRTVPNPAITIPMPKEELARQFEQATPPVTANINFDNWDFTNIPTLDISKIEEEEERR